MPGRVTEAVHETIEMLKASPIAGCITGSSLLDADFDTWGETPDVDVFVFNEIALIHAVTWLEFAQGYKPLTDGERWKINREIHASSQQKAFLSTIKLVGENDIIVNVTWKKACKSMMDVIGSFDMTIVMRGYDIEKKAELDLSNTWSDSRTAIPNPMRVMDGTLWNTDTWLRQFSRVIKYWNRGYDTRPMARKYIEMIDDTVKAGALFQTEKSIDMFNEYAADFMATRQKIVDWMAEKED